MTKVFIDYDKLQRDTLLLAEKLAKGKLITSDLQLVCISRGGLFVGGILAYALNIKDVYCVSLESYTSEELNSNEDGIICRTPFLPSVDPTRTYLFVDDINDTSQTYSFIKQQCERLGLMQYFACTYHKPRSNNLLPDYYGAEIAPDSWVVFPWERL